MKNDQKIVAPEVVIKMTDEQFKKVLPLKNKQLAFNKGMILGSVSLRENGSSGDTIGLSYIPHDLAEKIRDLATEYFGGNDANSETTKVQ